ncbi:BAG family molecular chaperone regulator 8, chloroplastic [Argentina anserina]|uniref:BAG family molecular chaperone regulator 8, chloroplastic n=1 Tax=Argentina anserina TaxID=57926 RepID=UPI002176446F|nr:BAG family molecular chaperone regulator 8, chloroplastic [Potentilla anserina]
MASHYQPHHHQHHPPTTTSCCCTTSYSSSSCCTQYPPPHSSPDPLLQAIASQILISNPPDPYIHHHHHPQNPHKTQKAPNNPKHRPDILERQQLHSLVSRIEALEASLHHHSSNRSRSSDSYSLRDYAARVIQTHFRTFLVRRSRTLRQLKDLAFIKSSFASLKSSISNRTHFDFHSVSHKAMALLIKLDSVQCGDPIVRDGKRSISRDIVRFLEFIEGIVVKRQAICVKPVKNVRSNVRPVQNVDKSRGSGSKCGGSGRDQREMIGKLRERIEKIRGFARVSENEEEDVELEGFEHVSDDDEENVGQYEKGQEVKRHGLQPKVKKSVTFAEDGNVLRVFSNSDETVSSGDGSDSSDDHGERVGNFSEVEDVKGFALGAEEDDEVHIEIGGSQQTSDAERNPRARMTQRRGHGQGQNEHLLFSPPLPVKMDSKEDLMKRNKGVKIVT